MGSKCKTCGLTERSHHPCNEAGTLYPCPDEFHREMSIVQCQQSGCTATGLTRARVWWCAIHHPEHPMGPVPPTPPPSAMRHWQHDETGRVCDCVDCPGPRYHEVNEAFAEAHEKAMREKCGMPAPADALKAWRERQYDEAGRTAPADDKCWKCGGGVERTNTTLPGCDNDIFHDGQPPALPTEGAHPNGPVDGCPCHLCRYAFGEDSTAPADDASGAEAVACVAPAHDMAPRIVVEPYGTSCWQVWLHIGAASWTVGDYRRDKDAAERFAEPLRHALRAALAAPLPARPDAVEEAARLREALLAQRKAWIDLPACGGTYCDKPDESGRMDCCQDATYHAAGEAIRAIDAALRREKESRSDDSRPASGHGGGK